MKNYLLLSAAALALCACERGPFKSAEFRTYEKFSQAYADGDCGVLLALSEGAARDAAGKFCAPVPPGGAGPSAAGLAAAAAAAQGGAVRIFHRDFKSRTRDGEAVTLTVVETVTGALKEGEPARRRQVVRLVKSGGGWLVADYEAAPLK